MQLQTQLPDELASLKELVPPPVPPVGSYFDVNVTLSASPSNFTVQSWADGGALEQLQMGMNRHYSDESNCTPVDRNSLREDRYFAGRHTDNFWYRVRVNSQLDEGTVAVRFVDYGDYSMMTLDSLCLLSSRYRNLPMQAINASLAGRKDIWTPERMPFANRLCAMYCTYEMGGMLMASPPVADIVPVNGDWTAPDTVWFSNRVVDRQFVTVIKSMTCDDEDSVVRIGVSLIDTTHPAVDTYVEKELVDAGKAAFLCV